ncbi:MAG: sulfur oxidation c-type cytochrome SoxX [Ideonella sp. WA131b]|jgi:sulfur-oxidizing protein SoxX|nr:sulfur oxidation c-type cytochrome SoxX [Ideonella sp. WA131b]
MTKKTPLLIAAVPAALLLAACASGPAPTALPSAAELDAEANRLIVAAFRDQGIAKAERIRQDLGQSACSSDKEPAEPVANEVMAQAKSTVKWPTGGLYLGDWREGERIAQNGRGLTWTDSSTATSANGGSCYNCHQISKEEVSFGTIGPSLVNYGKNRGVRDVLAPTSQSIIEYTWMKIWNSKTYNACSNMPRFGHMGILDEKQIAHVMALLLDPKSPVNQ